MFKYMRFTIKLLKQRPEKQLKWFKIWTPLCDKSAKRQQPELQVNQQTHKLYCFHFPATARDNTFIPPLKKDEHDAQSATHLDSSGSILNSTRLRHLPPTQLSLCFSSKVSWKTSIQLASIFTIWGGVFDTLHTGHGESSHSSSLLPSSSLHLPRSECSLTFSPCALSHVYLFVFPENKWVS